METEKRLDNLESRVDKVEAIVSRHNLWNKGKPITCPDCGNKWLTRSKKQLVSCTNCGKKIKNI